MIGRWISAICFAALTASSFAAERLTVFAAASLKDALDEIARAYQRKSNTQAIVSLAASSALARQIENGAPADVFISADREWMDYLAARNLIDPETRADLLTNRLVLIAPGASKLQTEIRPGFPLAALLQHERLALADPEHVPAGRYARAALEKLGVWRSVEAKLARTDNVRIALALVARGEAPLGIVYLSDALAENKVRVVAEFPADSHPPIVYPAAVVSASRNPAAREFLSYLRSEEARAIFEKHGFGRSNDALLKGENTRPVRPMRLTQTARQSYSAAMDYRERISIDPAVRSGKPCIRGLRITVADILEYLASGMSQEEILADFPDLRIEDIRAALAFAAERERRIFSAPV